MRQLLPCVTTEGEEEREEEREVRLGHPEEQIDWRLYTSLFLRDDEGKKYKSAAGSQCAPLSLVDVV